MFLTLDSAWKLLAIAFYGLLTFDAVAWAQITPVPGGLSSVQDGPSLSSSGSLSTDKKLPPNTGDVKTRPLLALRPDPESPPAPPAALPVGGTVPPTDKNASNFMASLESDLSGVETSATQAVVSFDSSQVALAAAKNTALNPAHAKSFVVQASATGELPPTPPAPPAPPAPPVAAPIKSPIKAAGAPAPPGNDLPKPLTQNGAAVVAEDEFSHLNSSTTKKQTAGEPRTEQPLARPNPSTATHMHIGDQPARPGQASSSPAAKATNNRVEHAIVTPSRSPNASKAESVTALPSAFGNQLLESIEFNDVPLADAMKLFSEQSGLNVITSAEAGKARVTVFLKQVTAHDALEAIVKANGLFYRIEAASGIVRIATSNEYEKDLSSFREEQTRVFTLLYPNPIAVAQVIQQVFGNRVQMNRADADMEDLLDLSRRFNRFDMVDGRSLGLGGANNTGNGGRNGTNSGALNGMTGNNALNRAMGGAGGLGGLNAMPGMHGNQQNFAQPGAPEQTGLNNLTSPEIQQLENELAQRGELSADTQADLLQRRDATIYISTIRRNNQIIVRTGDNRSMDQIAQLINQLDVPTPTVLLEVKVLRIVLADGFNSAFEYFGAAGNASTAMSDGSLQPAFPGASTAARALGAGLGVAGGVPGSLSFQMVDDKFRVRMQLLESKNCVTALATPLILTANNEVSRIFVGDTLPFTVGFTPSQVLSSVTAVNGAVAATPVTELRDVGQSLLITPNINADRTVTLRVIEENSERVLAGSSIPVPATSGAGVTNINVDTVRRRTISGTIVAQDGMAVALGGLIEEQVHDSRDQVPVLGNIPGLGLLFRRQASGKSRSELVVIVRPYVFNTPTESAATTEMLLGELSTHPNSPEVTGTMNALPCPVTRSETESSQRAKLFQLHNRSLSPN